MAANIECPNNSGLICEDCTKCKTCGFFPREERRRKIAIRTGEMSVNSKGHRFLKLKGGSKK